MEGYSAASRPQAIVFRKPGFGGLAIESSRVGSRYPSNVVIQHSRKCIFRGFRESSSYVINRWKNGAKPFGNGAGQEFDSESVSGGRVPDFDCRCGIGVLGDYFQAVENGT